MTGDVLWIFVFVFGAIVGSFLNVCIHRMPRGMKINQPSRSFCPACERQIPWYENLPIISWLMLRGKCSQCGAPISFRYVLVEILTASLFLACVIYFGLPLGGVYCVFCALLVVATFIDFEHLIIPDEITIGGTIAGWIFSMIFPRMMEVNGVFAGLGMSVLGSISGFATLWLIVEIGKRAFGKKKLRFSEAQAFDILLTSEQPLIFRMGEESIAWEEIFSRETDEFLLNCEEYDIRFGTGEPCQGAGKLRMYHNRLFMEEREIPLGEIQEIRGKATSVTIPREAMGFGDVKFIAAIGAFLGWKAVFFTIFAAAFVGAFAGLAMLLITRGKEGARIPFGPYLTLGALLWLFAGTSILEWYFSSFFPHPSF